MLTKKLLINCNKAARGWLFYDKNRYESKLVLTNAQTVRRLRSSLNVAKKFA